MFIWFVVKLIWLKSSFHSYVLTIAAFRLTVTKWTVAVYLLVTQQQHRYRVSTPTQRLSAAAATALII